MEQRPLLPQQPAGGGLGINNSTPLSLCSLPSRLPYWPEPEAGSPCSSAFEGNSRMERGGEGVNGDLHGWAGVKLGLEFRESSCRSLLFTSALQPVAFKVIIIGTGCSQDLQNPLCLWGSSSWRARAFVRDEEVAYWCRGRTQRVSSVPVWNSVNLDILLPSLKQLCWTMPLF